MTKEETWAVLVGLGVVKGKSINARWDLGGADLHGARLSEACLGEADLSAADLGGADLGGADLGGADLRKANLSAADLREAYLSGANLRGANLRRAYLTLAYLAGTSLGGADLSEAHLRGADLSGANLSEANLREADLTDATLSASILIQTDLTRANLSGACIDDANTSGWVINDVTCSHIREAKSGKLIEIAFGPHEFERKYRRVPTTAEVITHLPGGASMTDLQRVMEKYEKRIAELEAQVKDVKRKRDVLVEASRLLEEEAQTPDVSCG